MSELVTAEELVEERAEALVLDATVARDTGPGGAVVYRSGRAVFEAGHLPGASFADIVEVFSARGAALPLTRPSTSELGRAARDLGIDRDSRIVVYDSLSGAWAARIWWLLRAAGHTDVRVLDGGRAAWVAAGGELETGAPRPSARGTWTPVAAPGRWVDLDGVRAMLDGGRPGTLVCALRTPDFAAGHIPGSRHAAYNDLLDEGGAAASGAGRRRRGVVAGCARPARALLRRRHQRSRPGTRARRTGT
ncbi:Thiosulfate sulfurtransferase, rhodanese [Pseudonocardia sp. Ae717_Ps2]|uniref:sulfurtransferase n=1 Tax=unclassified Pseudonocardia TaxID=2619320 RepID=UPI000961E3D6|nr:MULTISPECIES: rhodanese-like domain-containing protein [unclassified Pseudonocardia]OLM14065.1 Thiosulfate sulfurtransferase, rhodanese [Pseudonocardia sp. Ae505_Ps2]OLM31245.1 Thiosulfate sulfurtransferase, rhodanese [Pseudonocardia sp. Ae717_Ps2]